MFTPSETRRALETLLRVLVVIGQTDNAAAIRKRSDDLVRLAEWVAFRSYGQHVWAEVQGGLDTAETLAPRGTEVAREVRLAQSAIERLNVALDDLVQRHELAPSDRRAA